MKSIQFAILIAISLFFCAGAKAQTLQPAYGVPTVVCVGGQGLRCQNLSGHPYILVGGYYSAGDNGGGYFAYAPGSCTDNGGTIIQNVNGQCFYRTDSRAAISVQWFGAKCDAVSTVYGGSTLSAGSNTFSSTSVTFKTGDVGKMIEFFPTGANAFRTTVTAVNTGTNTITLSHNAYNDYPGNIAAKSASFLPILDDGLDSPGTGYRPEDTLTVLGGTYGTQATVTVVGTGLVSLTPTAGGSGYQVGDLVSLTATTSGVTTVTPAQIQVTAVSGGAITGYQLVNYGLFESSGFNPSSFVSTGGHGSSFSISVSGDSSFGISKVKIVTNGSYQAPPPIPAATTDTTTGTASGATIDLDFPTPYFVYGSDDTTAFQNVETYIENDANRGIYNAAEVPADQACFLQTLQINRAVTWRSSGSRQAQLLQVIGATSSSADNVRYGFILVSANYPSFDTYQDTTIGQPAVGFNNLTIVGGTPKRKVDLDSGPNQDYTNDGLLFQNPTGTAHRNVNAAIQNLQVASFGGNAMSANHFSGEFRAYNVFAGNAGASCLDVEHVANPTRFYGFVGSGCSNGNGNGVGINAVSSKTLEFHGASVFNNDIDVSVTGTRASNDSYIVFDELQLGHSTNENMYLDQQNETVVCVSNCRFTGMNESGAKDNSDANSAIVIGPDAHNAFGGTTAVLRLNQGFINPYKKAVDPGDSNYLDIRFDTPTGGGNPCICTVNLGDGMVDLVDGTASNNASGSAILSGPIVYAGANVGPNVNPNNNIGPINVSPSEIGMGVTLGTLMQAGKAGLKLSVQCGSNSGTAKLVVLAGTGSAQTLLDNIGSNVAACP